MTITIAKSDAKQWETASTHRTPGISIKPLLKRGGHGESLEFNVVRFGGEDFWSPRHRHNFDQIRIGLEGETKYGKGVLKPRTIGYYPEGTWYGPLSVAEPSIQAILQLDGASRCGYVNYDILDAATEELKQEGTFSKGFYIPADGKEIDGFQASWERATGQQMIYPERRYAEPLYMNLDAFNWIDAGNGTATKNVGVFNEYGTSISMVKLAPGASAGIGSADRTAVAFVLSGEATSGEAALGTWGAALADHEIVSLTGVTESEIVVVTLPDFK
ncbi:quercetin dioxygenase-like cupin family protein [Arthrobacter ginsengisoli]|uniref:Quercetin dioxygenase-like cupin family protein n=1 Tax=Arthrobacter ginsengisoli TaxID=1356565 RepID=A0ABU1UHV2_9MICC|nr:hypothetical protein [Arthrobacter ginsengisoli]MDR7084716.1 quercetin dioxygenase-like cupin family protein [Arthrobacter ginsengisoli]